MIVVEMKKEELGPTYFAYIEDKIRQRNNKLHLNGTIRSILYSRKGLRNTVQYENPEELNVRRRAVGLCAIQLELWSEAQELPESLKGVKFK